jgi:hypothetical protein
MALQTGDHNNEILKLPSEVRTKRFLAELILLEKLYGFKLKGVNGGSFLRLTDVTLPEGSDFSSETIYRSN